MIRGDGKRVQENKFERQLAEMKVEELYERAKELQVRGRSRMTKEDLIRAIKEKTDDLTAELLVISQQ